MIILFDVALSPLSADCNSPALYDSSFEFLIFRASPLILYMYIEFNPMSVHSLTYTHAGARVSVVSRDPMITCACPSDPHPPPWRCLCMLFSAHAAVGYTGCTSGACASPRPQ